MKKSKGQTIDLLYTNKKESNKKTKNKSSKSKNVSKKKNTKTKNTKKTQNNNNEIINLDNEIIIGLTPKKEEEKKQKKTQTKKNKKKSNVKTVKKTSSRTQKKNNSNKKQNSKKKSKNKIIKWLFIIILFITVIILFMMSSIFNIKQIVVINNSKVSTEDIINLSTLTNGVNMFKISNKTIKEGIKTNAYVEDVVVKRNLNGTITLDIKERKATYMLKFANAYVYINNQGYMLEVSEKPIEIPIITGMSTANEEMKPGNRLNSEDLNRLDDIIKIMESSKNSPLANIITEIDVLNSNGYKLTVKSQKKTIRIDNITNINIKLQMAGKVFEAEKGKTGEIYFQENGKKAIFKENV